LYVLHLLLLLPSAFEHALRTLTRANNPKHGSKPAVYQLVRGGALTVQYQCRKKLPKQRRDEKLSWRHYLGSAR